MAIAEERLCEQVTKEYYQTTSMRSFEGTQAYYERSARGLLLRFEHWLPADRRSRCIDLACGCGEFLYLLSQKGFCNITGVDLCAEELEKAEKFVRAGFVHGDVVKFLQEQPSASADFISALNFLEHLSKDKLLVVLREIRRVLRPGGVLVAMVPNAISPFAGLTRHWDITHEWSFAPNNFRQLAALAGYTSHVEFRECGPVAHGVKSCIRFVAWQFVRILIAAYLLIELADTKGSIYTMDMLVRLRAPQNESSSA